MMHRFPAPFNARVEFLKLSLKLTLVLPLVLAGIAWAQIPLVQISSDPYTNTDTQHATEVEPDTFAFGNTIVATFQVGRGGQGGSSDTGWATSIDGGANWAHGFLPGLTKVDNPNNPYDLANDPGVGYDAAHGLWLIVTMPWAYPIGKRPPVPNPAVVVSRSIDGLNWDNPIPVTPDVLVSDKPWITCDNFPTSPFFGHCYVEWDQPDAAGLLHMNTSTDGGLTWGPTLNTGDNALGVGGLPLVQPNGRVIVPTLTFIQNRMLAYTSTDGGASWSNTVLISPVTQHHAAGNFRTSAMPTAEIDARGRVYVVWQDCKFRTNCTSNDLVLSTSTDGVTWTTPARIPIDAVNSTVDHFIPGLAVDPTTAGPHAHLALTYYYYSQANCSIDTCRLNVGFISSQDGGKTWTAARQLAGPMSLRWLPTKSQRPMVADYISTSFSHGQAFPAIVVAHARVGTAFNVAMYTTKNGLSVITNGPVFSSAGELPLLNAASDFDMTGDEDGEESESLSDVFRLLPGFDLTTLGDSWQQTDIPEGLRVF
jgi:hypothetical protein